MAQQNRLTLKTYFETGDVPTELEFVDLIDSFLNFADNESYSFDGQIHGGNSLETFSASKTFDANNGNNQKMLITGDTTIEITNELPGTFIFFLEIDSVTSPVITIGTSFGSVLDNSVDLINADNDINILTLIIDSENNKYYTINTKTA